MDWTAVEPQPGFEVKQAPEGTVWVCCACGKTARHRYGDPGTSWDESCSLNAVLCFKPKESQHD